MPTNGQPAQSVLARITTVQQQLLRSDAHSRCLLPVRPRRHLRRPCRGPKQAADLLVVRKNFRRLHLSTLRNRTRLLPARNLTRCALREDLTSLMIDGAPHRDAIAPIVEALCRVDRPASILTWKRSPRVQQLLSGLANGKSPLTHDGLDEADTDKAINHLRSLLEHTGVLAARDEPPPGSSDGSRKSLPW